jgi:hypothetical protein
VVGVVDADEGLDLVGRAVLLAPDAVLAPVVERVELVGAIVGPGVAGDVAADPAVSVDDVVVGQGDLVLARGALHRDDGMALAGLRAVAEAVVGEHRDLVQALRDLMGHRHPHVLRSQHGTGHERPAVLDDSGLAS